MVSQKYVAGDVANRPTRSSQAAVMAAPASTADSRIGCGSRNVGRGGPDGNRPDGALDSTNPP
jgi:hypothetical protein